jgi:hypothetical protein
MTLKKEIADAVEELSAIPYFPKERGARLGIMRAMEKFVSGPLELRWLIDTAVGRMRGWSGVAELRGLYCTRFKPKDGIEERSTIPGFTEADSEEAYHLEACERKQRELDAVRVGGGMKQIAAALEKN